MSVFNYNYEKIGERIRTLREAKGWSQTTLIEKLRDHNGAICRNKLSEIESGKYSDFKFSFVTAMCEIFNCDTGYLLCEYDERIRSYDDIHRLIGLSGDATLKLKRWYDDNDELIEIMNYLISHKDMFVLLEKIKAYCFKAEDFDKKRRQFRPATKARDDSDLLTATRYSIIEMFGQILNDIYSQDDTNKCDYQAILERARGF